MQMARRAGQLAADGKVVYRLDVGQPGFAAPACVRRAAADALENDRLGYTEARGLIALRRALADQYHVRYGLHLDPARIVITTGSSAGFVLAFLALFNPGARVGLACPGYPPYRNILSALDLDPVDMLTRLEDGFQPTQADIEQAGPLDGLILASPANPTGAMIAPEALAALCRLCKDRGTSVISDEIYHGLTYGPEQTTALAFDEDAIILSSFSKYYAMTGWRIGWMVVPEALVEPIERLQQNLFISAPAISQRAALAALSPEAEAEAEGYREVYRANRDRLLAALVDLGFGPIVPADGAFYIYAGVAGFGAGASALAEEWLLTYGIAVTPGIDFDPYRGEGFIRFSYAATPADVDGAIAALGRWAHLRR